MPKVYRVEMINDVNAIFIYIVNHPLFLSSTR